MQEALITIYYVVIVVAAIVSMLKYKQLDKALRSISILLYLTVLAESLSYISSGLDAYRIKNIIYHVFSIIELILVCMFFIFSIRAKSYKQSILAVVIASFAIGILNIYFLQPIYTLNSNMLMFESFVIITMSLYYIYWLVKKNITGNFFSNSHFIITLLLLLLWSTSFFFWAFIAVLYKEGWAYTEIVSYTHLTINIIVYLGIGITLFYNSRNLLNHDH